MNTDGLTGLWNHRYFKEILDREIKKSQRYKNHLSLMMLDVDHFKNFNDKYGHTIGDLVLQKVALTIKENIRETDIVGRFGGEEFIVISKTGNIKNLYALSEKIRILLSELNITGAERVTASFGGSISKSGMSIKELINKADKSLYEAKAAGRNKVIVS